MLTWGTRSISCSKLLYLTLSSSLYYGQTGWNLQNYEITLFVFMVYYTGMNVFDPCISCLSSSMLQQVVDATSTKCLTQNMSVYGLNLSYLRVINETVLLMCRNNFLYFEYIVSQKFFFFNSSTKM